MSASSLKPKWLLWPQTQALVAAFGQKPDALRFVGGAVRDSLLGREVVDIDAATVLLPDEVMDLLAAQGIKVIPTGIAHGTVTAVIEGTHFEITTLRKDTSCDGRHADVVFTDDWQTDAKRRDFTMNALYMSPRGDVFDYFGGEEDARQGLVRFIGIPQERIREDYLRILRFFRFHAHYGKGAPDAQALKACASLAQGINSLSGERIQQELLKLLSAPIAQCYETVCHMYHSGILDYAAGIKLFRKGFSAGDILSGLVDIEVHIGLQVPAAMRLTTFVLESDTPNALELLSQRLRLPQVLTKQLQRLLEHIPSFHPDMPVLEQKRLLRRLGAEFFSMAIAIKWSMDAEPVFKGHAYERMLLLAETWEAPPFPVSGNDLIAAGFAPGKSLGDKLAALELAWEESDYRLTREELLRLGR